MSFSRHSPYKYVHLFQRLFHRAKQRWRLKFFLSFSSFLALLRLHSQDVAPAWYFLFWGIKTQFEREPGNRMNDRGRESNSFLSTIVASLDAHDYAVYQRHQGYWPSCTIPSSSKKTISTLEMQTKTRNDEDDQSNFNRFARWESVGWNKCVYSRSDFDRKFGWIINASNFCK